MTAGVPDLTGRHHWPAHLPYDVRLVLEGASDAALEWAYQLAGWTDPNADGHRWFVVRRNGWPWYACQAPSGQTAEAEAAMIGGGGAYHGIYVGAVPFPDLVCLGRRVHESGFAPEG